MKSTRPRGKKFRRNLYRPPDETNSWSVELPFDTRARSKLAGGSVNPNLEANAWTNIMERKGEQKKREEACVRKRIVVEYRIVCRKSLADH